MLILSGTLETMSLVEAGDLGVLRTLVRDPQKALDALKDRFTVKTSDVLAIQTDDAPGALAKALALFASNKTINIEYMYGFTSRNNVTAIILSVNEPDAALELLQKGNVKLVNSETLFG